MEGDPFGRQAHPLWKSCEGARGMPAPSPRTVASAVRNEEARGLAALAMQKGGSANLLIWHLPNVFRGLDSYRDTK
jgi:hypothetical protein